LVLLLSIAALANWAAIEAWHHGSIFANLRGWLEARGGFLSELLLCPYCLSHWTALPLLCMLGLLLVGLEVQPHQLISLPVLSLAVTRLSNLMNDLNRGICRTPNRHNQDLAELGNIASKEHDA
jgi:hypothetical protein